MNPESPRLPVTKYEFGEGRYVEVYKDTKHIFLSTNFAENILDCFLGKGLEREKFYLIVMQTSFSMEDIQFIPNVADFQIKYKYEMYEKIKSILKDEVNLVKRRFEDRGELSLIFGR